MTLIEINKKYYSIPTSWNELTPVQLVKVTKILYSNITVARAHLKLLHLLTGISKLRFLIANTDQLAEYFYLTEFFITKNDLQKQLIPKFRGRYGPAEDLNNLIGSEYAFCEAFFENYIADDSNLEALHSLIAVLYRPGRLLYNKRLNKLGDVRRPFNSNLLPRDKKIVARWPWEIKQAILTWYIGCKENLINNNREIFEGAEGDAPLHGMWSIMRSVAEKGNHGDFQKIEKMLIKEIMMELKEFVNEAKRLEKIKP